MSQTKNFFRASAEDFKKIPGSPVAYWAGEAVFRAFADLPQLGSVIDARIGMVSGDNGRFLRLWHEVDHGRIEYCALPLKDPHRCKWYPLQKGGGFRLWYGNTECVVDWENDGWSMINDNNDGKRVRSHNYNGEQQFKEGITWNSISSASFSCRYSPAGFTFDAAGPLCEVIDGRNLSFVLGFLSSKVARFFLSLINPTINFPSGYLESLPYQALTINPVDEVVKKNISISRADWDSYETSWDFSVNPLIAAWNLGREKAGESSGEVASSDLPRDGTLQGIYEKVRAGWAANCEEMRRLETENNRIFIEAYGLQDELTPEVPWEEITLTCNPWYRYGVRSADDGEGAVATQELEERLRADTVKELVSYAVGCMMGRYAIDKPGLVLANQGATYEDYLAQISEPAFAPDYDGIIPILEDDCFADDIVTQFHRFLRITFGERNFNANLSFIEDALGKDLRSYFVKDFYADHLQRYQKRPIYWFFSSPKGTFSALIYLHRYYPGTVGQVLGYLRSHITKIQSRVDAADRTAADLAATQGMKTRAIKERAKLVRQLKELEDYERDVLHPLAGQRIEIDLDDGVKANYPKFGKALRKIPGLE